MITIQVLELEIGDARAPIHILDETTERSPHTGRALKVLKGEVHAIGEEGHDSFNRALADQGAGIWSCAQRDVPRQRWIVARRGYSISGDRYRYDVTLREVEEIAIRMLVLDGIELNPYRYEEEVDAGEVTMIRAFVRVSGDVLDRLGSLMRRRGECFSVIRHGINEVPLEGRFGACGWSEHDEERKYSLAIVPRSYDEKYDRPPLITEVERASLRDSLAFRIEFMENVLQLLLQKGVLTDQQVEEARDQAVQAIPERRLHFMKVDDVDDLGW